MLFGKYVNRFYRRYWYDFVLGIFFLVIVDIAQLILPNLIQGVVNMFGVYPAGSAEYALYQPMKEKFFDGFWMEGNLFELKGFSFSFLLTILACVAAVMFCGRAGWRYAILGLGINIDYDLREPMFEHATKLSVSYYKTQKIGTMMEYFNSDLEDVKSAFTDGTIFLIDFLVLGTLSLVKMFRISPLIASICLIPLLMIVVTGIFVEHFSEKKYSAQLTAGEAVSDFAQEDYSGMSVVKAFVREPFQSKIFRSKVSDYKKASLGYVRFSLLLDSIYGVFINSVFVVAILIGVNEIQKGNLIAGSLSGFMGYLDALIWPMFAISGLVGIIARSYASLKKVTKFLDMPIDLKDVSEEEGKNLPPFNGDILFSNLNFSYPDDNRAQVLSDISLHVRPGDNIGIVGRTGSGKSTLVKVLLKIYNIPEGKLFINGVDINKWPAKLIRKNIGYVAQNAFLFSEAVKDNIAFSEDRVDEAEVKKAASFACVDKAISEFANGYDTIVGERGTTLSGGQKQRIAMARAIINNPPVLILDDSVSAVDSDTEKQILKNIRELRKGKTTFIVSSRISSVENMDNIIVMDKGHIVGIGDHQELMQTCPLYQDIVRLQELEKEEN